MRSQLDDFHLESPIVSMVPDISSVLTRVRGIKSKIFLLIEEAEAIRANLTDVCEVMSESIISTRLPSAAVTGNNSPALTTTGYDLNSPAASTIYLGNRYRSARSRLSLSGTTSPELENFSRQSSLRCIDEPFRQWTDTARRS